jgi:hypothetical protein
VKNLLYEHSFWALCTVFFVTLILLIRGIDDEPVRMSKIGDINGSFFKNSPNHVELIVQDYENNHKGKK